MLPLLVLVGVSGGLLALTLAQGKPLADAWPTALRYGLAAMFLMTGATHFIGLRQDFVAMVPPALPAPELLVTLSGAIELTGAAGLLKRRTTPLAATGLGLLLIALYPANVYAATSGPTLSSGLATPLLPRTMMQIAFLATAVAVAVAHRGGSWSLRGVTATLPTATGPSHGETPTTVLVSRLELRSVRHVSGFLVASLRLRRAFQRSRGAVRLNLAAQPLGRTFFTWSSWTSESAMQAYTRCPLHVSTMQTYRAAMQDSTFTFLHMPGDPEPRTWVDVRRLLTSGSVGADPSRSPAASAEGTGQTCP